MILTADIGNTNICFALHPDDSAEPLFFERIHTNCEKTSAEYASDLKTILRLHEVPADDVTASAVSSVVPVVTKSLKAALEQVLACPILEISSAIDLSYAIHVDDPRTVGHDILSDVAGAVQHYPLPVITFDMGTATVATMISEEKVLEGILICPGVRTSLNSLASSTSALPTIALDPPEKAIGRNTVDSMKSGIIYGMAGLMDGIIDRMEEETGKKCTVVATGGLSPFIAPYARHEILLDSTLLMKGMYALLKRNL